MISVKLWVTRLTHKRDKYRTCQMRREGWFLFGIIPLFVRDLDRRPEGYR